MSTMWNTAADFEDIRYETSEDGIAKITINRPEVRNAFRPQTVKEMLAAFELAHEDEKVGVIILTGEGEKAFCSGGDQKVRGHAGYVGSDGVPRLNILDVQKKIRGIPKPVIAMVAGFAIGGVKEKVLAAHRAGVKHVILPIANGEDVEDIPDNVLGDIEIHLADRVEDVFDVAFA